MSADAAAASLAIGAEIGYTSRFTLKTHILEVLFLRARLACPTWALMPLFEMFFRKLPGGAAENESCGGFRKKSRKFEDSTEGAALGTLEKRLNGDKAHQFGLYLYTRSAK
jgi:hypothetical protein